MFNISQSNSQKTLNKMKTKIYLVILIMVLQYLESEAQSGIEKIYLLEYQDYYETLEARSRTDLSKDPLAKAMRIKGRRNDRLGWLPVGSELNVLKKSMNSDGELYYNVKHPANDKINIWIKGSNFIVTDDPRVYYDLKAEDNRKFKGYLICGINSDNSGGSINELEMIDDILGKITVKLSDCIEFKIIKGKLEISVGQDPAKIQKYSGRIYSGDLKFISESFSLEITSYSKNLVLTKL
jgi:hypothetical protein